MIPSACIDILAVLFADELKKTVEIRVLVHFLDVFWGKDLHLDVFFKSGKTGASLILILYHFIFCN